MSYDDRVCDATTLHEQNIVERGEAAVRAAVMRDLESGEKRLRPVVAEVDDLVSRLSKLESNDIGNAERLSTRFGHNLIFVANRGWFSWTETHWLNKEGRNFVRAAAIKTARLITGEAQCIEEQGQYLNERETDFDRRIAARRQHANNSGNLSKIRGMVELAEIDLNIEPEELDQPEELLNLQNGTLVLEGACEELLKQDRSHLITKALPVSFDPQAGCPQFLKFLV